MKMLTLLFLASLCAGANGLAQKITISLKNAPLEKVFKEVERQTHYRFIYTKEQLENTGSITIDRKNTDIETLLHLCFKEQPLDFTIENKYILIKTVEQKKNSVVSLMDVKGTVINETGQPVEGVTVQIKGSNKISITNKLGEFYFNGIDPGAILLVSGAEIQPEEIKINGQQMITIRATQKISTLDETIVIGYGTTTRRYSTGSVSKVTAEEIGQQPVTNPLAALQGRVPGLVVTSTSGLPGSSFTIQIRGQNSLNPNPGLNAAIPPLDNPLFIIDGVPFAPQNANINQFASLASPGNNPIYGNQYGGMSPFNSINPADIESIEVLRDADATAIYGSRAANGVILITTKKGKSGKTKFDLNINTGQSKVTRSLALMNTEMYRSMRREAFSNDGITPNTIPGSPGYAADLLIFDSTKYTNWKNYFIGGTAGSTSVNASLSGGTANTNFLISAGYGNNSYIIPGNFGSDRATMNMNLGHYSLDRRLSVELSANYSYDQNNSSGNQFLLQAFILPPNYPDLVNENGSLNWSYKGFSLNNPLGYLKQKYRAKNYNLNSHFQVNYELTKGLQFRSSFGYNTFSGNETSQNPLSSFNPASNSISSSRFGTNNFQTWLIEPQLEYKKKMGKAILNILTGGTYQQNTNSQTTIEGTNYPNDNLLGSISAAGSKNSSDAFYEKKYVAIFGRVNYRWNNRYILNLNGRRDGSSRFGPGKQFGNFGSLGIGWLFSEESFIKKALPFISYGKLRTSYGSTGNDNILDYQFLSRWGPASISYQGTPGYIPQNLYNADLHWSSTRKFESALELGLFKDRIFINLAWYRHRSADQLVTYILPTQTGFRGVTANFPALVENTGWEIQINAANNRVGKFTWKTSINLTIPKNKLIAFPGIESSSYANLYVVGQSLSVLNVFKYRGVNKSTGIYEFDSKNGSTSNPGDVDRHIIGNLDPVLFGGLNNAFQYKGFQMDIFMEFKKQVGANYLQQINNFPPGFPYNQPVKILHQWQHPGDQANIQRFTSQNSSPAVASANAFMRSSGAYSDASYIRLKTFSLSYDFSRNFLTKMKISGLKLYVNAQNLFIITGYKGNDPETRSFYSLPPLKTIVAGLQFTF